MPVENIASQITAYEQRRLTLISANEALIEKSAKDGSTFDEPDQQAFDANEADIAAVDKHLGYLRTTERRQAELAKPVQGQTTQQGADTRAYSRIEVKNIQVPQGAAFTRYVMALARSNGNRMEAVEVAKQWNDSTPEVERVLKAAVAAGTTTDPAWAGALVDYQNMTSAFAELLRNKTIIGRIPGLRHVPFNIKVPRQTSGSRAQWVGEGKSKPVSKLGFDQITLGMTKLAGIVVLSDELVRSSNPSAEQTVRNDLIATITETMDNDFVDPTKVLVPGVSPGSITNLATEIPSSGPTADDARADFQALVAEFLGNNLGTSGAVWIMSEMQALQLAMLNNVLGAPEFPGMQVNATGNGVLLGLPVVASENVTSGVIILAKAPEILIADDGQTVIDVSKEASIQMDDAPASPPAAPLVNFWQQNLIGIRAERYVNWTVRRDDAVAYISGANYTGIAPVVP